MTTLKSHRRSRLLADLALAAAICVLIAGLSIALAWITPLELVPPRPR